MSSLQHEVTVLGLGNEIMGDDAVGLRMWDGLREARPNDANFVYGGIAGLELVPDVMDAHRLLVLDAVSPSRRAQQPGEIVVLHDEEIPQFLRTSLSAHQLGLIDLLGAARLAGHVPEHVSVVGIVVDDVDLRVGISDLPKASIAAAVEAASTELTRLREHTIQ